MVRPEREAGHWALASDERPADAGRAPLDAGGDADALIVCV
jgi:hypothetical protein